MKSLSQVVLPKALRQALGASAARTPVVVVEEETPHAAAQRFLS
jgi:bifunctional DNA-binding transcriptional regulator/antitoxin component of YhaV-PrlF toxin-antitoxin module